MPYEDLLQSAKFNPDRADFKELRLAYACSLECHPKIEDQELDLRKALADFLNQDDWEAGIGIVNRLLELCYLDIEAHMIAASIYRRTGDERRSSYHLRFAKGLLDSIFQSGDGQSRETAFTVVNVAEEYTVLRVLGVHSICQSFSRVRGHFDIFEVLDPTSGQRAAVYFNTDSTREGRVGASSIQ